MNIQRLGSSTFRLSLVSLILSLAILFSGLSPAVAKPPEKAKEGARQSKAPTPSKEVRPQTKAFPVIFDGVPLFSIRVDRKAIPASVRAEVISARLRGLAEDLSIDPKTITVVDEEDFASIIVGERIIMGIMDSDAAAEGLGRMELAEAHAFKIREAIVNHRKTYSLRGIFLGIALAVLVIAATLVLLWLLARLFVRLQLIIETRYKERIQGLHIQSLEIIQADRIRAAVLGAVKVLKIAVFAVVIYVCLHSLFGFFPWTRGFAGKLLSYVLIPLKAVGSGIVAAIPNMLILAVIFVAARYFLKLLRLLFQGIEKGTVVFPGFDAEWAQLTYKLARLLFVVFVAVIAFPYIPGSESPAFKGISIFFGILFSLGSQSAVANIIAGIALTYRRAFRVGDRIRVSEVTGDVAELKLQTTRLHTIKNEDVIIPNSTILNSNVINYTTLAKDKGLILHTSVTIGYDAPWRQVHALLLMAAQRTPGLLSDPPPFILQTSLDDFFVTYELNVYTDTPEKMAQIYSLLHQNIQDTFNEYGVQIMSPHYVGDKATPTYVPRERWFDPPSKEQE